MTSPLSGTITVATRRIRRLAVPSLGAQEILARTMAPVSEHPTPIGHHPRLTDRDETIFLLHTATEIEHALLVQYLYAMYSLKSADELSDPQRRQQVAQWRDTLLQIAREEMAHLVTAQNLLRWLGGPLNLEREDFPFRSGLYPFHFRLEPLTKDSLAKYVFAEMPADVDDTPENQEIRARANAANDNEPLNHVGVLFARLIELIGMLPADMFLAETAGYQAASDDWDHFYPDLVVRVMRSREEALMALQDIAVQGEGMTMGRGTAGSHYERFLSIYRDFPEADADWTPTRATPVNPNTEPPYEPVEGASERAAAEIARAQEMAGGYISHPKAHLWAHLFNHRYRMLLANLMHALSIDGDEDAAGQDTGRALTRRWTFDEMFYVTRITGALVQMPLASDDDPQRAGPPFEMPYTLAIPDREADRWRLHRDLIDDTSLLMAEIRQLGTPSEEENQLLDAIARKDEADREEVNARVPEPQQITAIHQIRVLPAWAIGRLGSAAAPMDNYHAETDGAGFRRLTPAETLVVDRQTSEITGVTTPASVRFKDGEQIRPVAPFVEIWAQFHENGPFQPLTSGHVTDLDAEVTWQVRAGNLKAFRRTGDEGDRITADTQAFNDHQVHPLVGQCDHFKPGKSMALGDVQYIKPTDRFPELRLRFTPAAGHVYGPDAGDPNIVDDVYNADPNNGGGRWKGHRDGAPNTPFFTFPAGIFASDAQGLSRGYLDDTCDGLVEAAVTLNGQTHRAYARISAGPPDFAPDSFPVRSVNDDLHQMLLGVDAENTAEAEALQEAESLIRRALETARLMNTDDMNQSGMAFHDARSGRAREPIFQPLSRADYDGVRGFHRRALEALAAYGAAPTDANKQQAIGWLRRMVELLRQSTQVVDLSTEGRHRMPAMMRGSDGRYLAATRRQLNHVRQALVLLQGEEPDPADPQQAMINLIRSKSFGAGRHGHINAGGDQTLADLFDDPPQLLVYLQTATVTGGFVPAAEGRPLVAPGDPEQSGFIQLITNPGHPMNRQFDDNDVQVVREWILSLSPLAV